MKRSCKEPNPMKFRSRHKSPLFDSGDFVLKSYTNDGSSGNYDLVFPADPNRVYAYALFATSPGLAHYPTGIDPTVLAGMIPPLTNEIELLWEKIGPLVQFEWRLVSETNIAMYAYGLCRKQ